MRPTRDSAYNLLSLLLLVGLLRPSWCRPAHNVVLCNVLRSAVPHLDQLVKSSGHFHDLSGEFLVDLLEDRLESLPVIQTTAAQLHLLKVNESLSLLYVHTLTFKAHVDWLKKFQEDVSLPTEAAGGASAQLLQLANLIKVSLHQVKEPVPQPMRPPSFPAVSAAFEALRYSVEVSQNLKVFCSWSKRVVRHVQKVSRCPRR
ncbi:uncharacterized protein LOC133557722 [Nerophis ophidion]|uniref:uncharacterized protein LOC133557722 n=1 Tax=Nerophis ophidion TaxID=159077 RepID=UPI002AE06994|nr:uncharacterized protein LOC133557722 [Nerophis ophidion]